MDIKKSWTPAMKRSYNYCPVTPDKWDELYQYYIDNKSNQNWFPHVLSQIQPYMDMCKRSFKVRAEYWDEYECRLEIGIWRAFEEFHPERGARFSTWVYRLAKQSAWGFIKSKCKENDETMKLDELNINGNYIADCPNPEDVYTTHEHEENINNKLSAVIAGVLRGPIEREVWIRKNGVLGYTPQSIDTIAKELNLTTKTVEQIITRNNNCMSIFKKFLRENDLNRKESMQNIDEIIKSFKESIIKK